MNASATNIILLCILLWIAVQDVRTNRISNRMILIGLSGGLLFQVSTRGGEGVLNFLVLSILPVIILYSLFRISALGAGDIKLFSMIGSFLTVKELCGWMILSFGIGAGLALLILIKNGLFQERIQFFFKYLREAVVEFPNIKKYGEVSPGKKYVMHFTVPMLLGFLLSAILERGGLY